MGRWREPLAAILLLGLTLSAPLRSQTPPQPNVAFTFTFDTYSIYPTAVAVDANGNSYMAGTFSFGSDGFPVSADAAQTDRASMWVAKIDSSGSRIVWATYLGGHHNRNTYWRGPLDSPSGISVDPEGNVYVAGYTAATDFPAVNAFISSPPGRGTDGFLVKLNPLGTKILFSTYLGGLDVSTRANAVASDWAGNSYVALDADRWLGFETRDLSEPGTTGGVVIVKVNPAGGVVYATRLGSSQDDYINEVAVDPFGSVHFGGRAGGRNAALIAAIDPSGSRLLFSPFLLRAGIATSIATDSAGATYATGVTTDATFPIRNAYQPVYGGNGDFFLTKLDRSGSIVFSTFLGGAGAETSALLKDPQVLVDPGERATVVGMTQSLGFRDSADVRHPDVPMFKTRDGGRTWTRIVGGLQRSVSALAVTETGPRIWYAGADDGIWRSIDQGESWQRTGGTGFAPQVSELAIDPRSPDTVYAGTVSGTYKTDGGGQRWTLIDSASFYPAWIGTALGVDGNGWVFTGTRGFRRSRDGGSTWEDLNAGLRVGPTGVYEQVYAMSFGAAAGVIWAVQSDGLHRTEDGGQSWTLVPRTSFGPGHSLAVPLGRPHRLFFSLNGALARSDDDGATWKTLGMAAGRVLIRPGRPDMVYVLNGFRRDVYQPAPLFVSNDAGESWVRGGGGLPDQVTTMSFDPREPDVALLAAPIRSLTLALGLDRPAKHARFSGVLEQGTFVRAAQDPSGALYIVMTKDGKPTLVKLRTP